MIIVNFFSSLSGNKRLRIGDSANKNPVFMEGVTGVKPLNPMEPETAQLQKLVRFTILNNSLDELSMVDSCLYYFAIEACMQLTEILS